MCVQGLLSHSVHGSRSFEVTNSRYLLIIFHVRIFLTCLFGIYLLQCHWLRGERRDFPNKRRQSAPLVHALVLPPSFILSDLREHGVIRQLSDILAHRQPCGQTTCDTRTSEDERCRPPLRLDDGSARMGTQTAPWHGGLHWASPVWQLLPHSHTQNHSHTLLIRLYVSVSWSVWFTELKR